MKRRFSSKRSKFRLSNFITSNFYKNHMAELHKFIEEEIENELSGAYVSPSTDKKGRCRLFVAMGDDHAFQGFVSWKDFAEMFLDSDIEEMLKFLPLMEKLVSKMKARAEERA
jgi:hypothetical protein